MKTLHTHSTPRLVTIGGSVGVASAYDEPSMYHLTREESNVLNRTDVGGATLLQLCVCVFFFWICCGVEYQ